MKQDGGYNSQGMHKAGGSKPVLSNMKKGKGAAKGKGRKMSGKC